MTGDASGAFGAVRKMTLGSCIGLLLVVALNLSLVSYAHGECAKFRNREECLTTLCRPYERACQELAGKNDPNYHFLYLLCGDTWNVCYKWCNGNLSASVNCMSDAINEATGYWRAACWPLSNRDGGYRSCVNRGAGTGQAALDRAMKDPECTCRGPSSSGGGHVPAVQTPAPAPGGDPVKAWGLRRQIIGKWKWFNGGTPDFRADGTIDGNPQNTWTVTDAASRQITVKWGTRWIDTLRLSADRNRLEGQNQNGNRVWADKIRSAGGSTGSHTQPPPPVTVTPPAAAGMEQGTDRLGQDYAYFALSREDPSLCMEACRAQDACKAWTYVKPGYHGPGARCCLKHAVPPPTPNSCCVSGVK